MKRSPIEVAPLTADEARRIHGIPQETRPTCAACSKPIAGRPIELDEGAVMLCPGDACVNAYARKHAPKRYDPDAPMIVVGPNGEEMTQRELCRRTLEGPDRATPSPPADTTRAKGEG